MLRWTAGVTKMDQIRNDTIRKRFGAAPIAGKIDCGCTISMFVDLEKDSRLETSYEAVSRITSELNANNVSHNEAEEPFDFNR
ncbi:hypothetical protein TELCIR_05262 [Teladorsagia circumcincta]|uniref:Uncharacterized protein n=1 Tax=Teladorsagia circumcincta TaxID=45464 RepID=A0A2G9UR77_TELCI|nr:hypothetical protein TELCIR_05262 [Teladorsagia circumcincta]